MSKPKQASEAKAEIQLLLQAFITTGKMDKRIGTTAQS